MPAPDPESALNLDGVNFYEVLGLPSPGARGSPSASTEQVKAAYRRALLRYHPDKLSHAEAREASVGSAGSRPPASDVLPPTIDQVRAALTVLTTPALRREHDLRLRTAGVGSEVVSIAQSGAAQRTTELEVLDLDDLEFDSKSDVYFRACRCGNPRGFAVAEDDLVNDDDDPESSTVGEVLLECPDCSHHLRVTFSFVEPDGG